MQLLKTILKEVKKHKIDAVIASDFAVMEYCRQLHIPLHVSTQANVSNIESIKFSHHSQMRLYWPGSLL